MTAQPQPQPQPKPKPASGPSARQPAIGARQLRHEDSRLLTGRGRYVADITLPHLLHAAFVRAWPAHARILSIDVGTAAALDGVVAVLTAADFAETTMIDGNWIPGLAKTPQPVLAVDKVRFVGEAVAIVIAEDRYIAEDACDLVAVDYDVLPAVTEPGAGAVGEPLLAELSDNLIYDQQTEFGPTDDSWARATHVFTQHFSQARSTAAPMECRGVVADYDPSVRTLDVWASTQSPHLLRRRLAGATGLPEHLVRVMMHDVGGGFGQKIAAQPEELVVAQAAVRVGRPVKWIEDRREHFLAAPQARDQRVSVELATDDEGNFLAMRATILGDAGAYSFNSASALIESYITARSIPGVYRLPAYSYAIKVGLTNKAPIAPYRGVGFVPGQAARELVIDKAARALGIDRVELRRKNMVRPEDFSYRSCTGLVYDSGSYQESLAKACEMVDYAGFAIEQEKQRANGRYLGLGISPYVEPGGWGSEGMNQIAWHSFPSNDSARITIDLDGKVTVSVGTPSQGQGIETTLAQVAADVLDVPFDDVRVIFGDTSSAPISMAGTRASRVATVLGGAVGLAAGDLRTRILNIAGMVMEYDSGHLTIVEGMVQASDGGSARMPLGELIQRAFRSSAIRQIDPEPNFNATRFYDPGASYSNACVAVIVEVDIETGGVRVLRLAGAEDCGTVINPMIVEGQFAGGAIQGLGAALLERLSFEPGSGEPQTTSFVDYLMPTSDVVPEIEIAHLASPSPNTWRGIKGVGESGAIGVPAAIAAAVADAIRPLRPARGVSALPLLPQDVYDMLYGPPEPGAASGPLA
jgi:carbon-monoxide dehydrogenase large subunit